MSEVKTPLMWGRIAGRGRRRGRRRQNGRSRWQAQPCCCKTARVQSVEARVPEKLTISGNTDSSPLDVVLVRACDLLARTAIPRRTLGSALGVSFMLCCVLSCVAVSLGGCYIFTPAAATYLPRRYFMLTIPYLLSWLQNRGLG